jgi:dTDP-4-amino-4,6-dideoxygalactose transaminase
MTAGEGGIIVTNDDELEWRARSIHDCGRMPGEWFYSHFFYGSNYRLSEWQGVILSQQLARLDDQAAIRTRNADYLDRALSEIEGITPQALDLRCTRNGHYAYIFHYEAAAFDGVPIERFVQALNAEGVPTQASYPPVHALDLFQNGAYHQRLSLEHWPELPAFLSGSFPNTARGAWETVWLPQPVLLGAEGEMAQVVQAINKIQRYANLLEEA